MALLPPGLRIPPPQSLLLGVFEWSSDVSRRRGENELNVLHPEDFSPSLDSKIQRILSGSSSLHSLKSRGFSPSLSLVPQISHAGDKAGARSHWSDLLSRDLVLCSMIRRQIIKTS